MWFAPRLLVAVAAFCALSPALAAENQTPIFSCLVAIGEVANSENATVAQAAMLGSVYWLGRLDPALTEAELENRMSALSGTLSGDKLQAELRRCGAEMSERGQMLQRVGQKMLEKAVRAPAH